MRGTSVKATVFLGGGRITSALVAGLRAAGCREPIVVLDRHPSKLRLLERGYRISAETDLQRALAQAGLLILAVRPESVADLVSEIANVERKFLAVSLAAGIPLSKLRSLCEGRIRWARAMPSPACRTGRGLTAITFDRTFPQPDRARVRSLFAVVGPVLEIPEHEFDTFTVTYSTSHGYHALKTLAEAAVKLGLDRKTAFLAAAHALADAILSWREGSTPLNDLLEEAATPGGIAASVMDGMNSAGYVPAVQRGLQAGLSRAKTNAKS